MGVGTENYNAAIQFNLNISIYDSENEDAAQKSIIKQLTAMIEQLDRESPDMNLEIDSMEFEEMEQT